MPSMHKALTIIMKPNPFEALLVLLTVNTCRFFLVKFDLTGKQGYLNYEPGSVKPTCRGLFDSQDFQNIGIDWHATMILQDCNDV